MVERKVRSQLDKGIVRVLPYIRIEDEKIDLNQNGKEKDRHSKESWTAPAPKPHLCSLSQADEDQRRSKHDGNVGADKALPHRQCQQNPCAPRSAYRLRDEQQGARHVEG